MRNDCRSSISRPKVTHPKPRRGISSPPLPILHFTIVDFTENYVLMSFSNEQWHSGLTQWAPYAKVAERFFMPEITRRSLLRSAPVALLSSARAAKPLSIAFVTEPGGTHLSLLAKGIGKCPGLGGVAIADPSGESFASVRERLRGYGASLRTFKGHAEMIRALTPDLTVITVEARNNPPIVEAA